MNDTPTNPAPGLAQRIAEQLLTSYAGTGDRLAIKKKKPGVGLAVTDVKETDLGGRCRGAVIAAIQYELTQDPVLREAREALKDGVDCCPDCAGTGVWHMMLDETEIGQPPGSSKRTCRSCEGLRAALAKLDALMKGSK